mmetsp:Transcript_39580/g.91377  ORF Transcript_39580/g.91377 Transcript_39580/m.91377 type:complete len:580 (-) Transcript_39580:198-1937(-)
MLGDPARANAQEDDEEDEEAERAWEAATRGFEAPEGSKVIGEAELTITPTAADVPPVQIVPKEDEFEDAREDVVKPRKRWEAGACAAEENGHAEDEADEEEDEEADEVEYEEEEALYDEEEDRRTVALWEAATQGFEVKSKGPQSNEFTLKIKMSQMQPRFNLRTMKLYCGWLETKFEQLRKEYGQEALNKCRADVDFSQNKLSDDMTQELLHPFEEKDVSIGLLKLHKNRLSSEGVAYVCQYMLRETKADPPLEIHLSHNLIDDEGASCMLKTIRQLREKGTYPPVRQDHSQEPTAVPVWIRMEQNLVLDPDTVIENARDEGVTTCPARDRNCCGPGRCWKTRTPLVHMYMFMVQAGNEQHGKSGGRESKGKGKRKGKDQGKTSKEKENRKGNHSPRGDRVEKGKDTYKGKDGTSGKKGKEGYGSGKGQDAYRYGKDSYADSYGTERYGKGKGKDDLQRKGRGKDDYYSKGRDDYYSKGKDDYYGKGKDDYYGKDKGDFYKGKGGGKPRWADQPPLHQPPARHPQTPRQYLENPNKGKGGVSGRRVADYDWEDERWSSNNRSSWGDSWHGGEWNGQSW